MKRQEKARRPERGQEEARKRPGRGQKRAGRLQIWRTFPTHLGKIPWGLGYYNI